MATFLDQLTEEKGKLKLLREDRIISQAVKFNLFFLFLCLVLLAIFWQRLPLQVPLFFSRPWGESQLASPRDLFLLPFLSFLVLIINLVLIFRTIEGEKVLARILAGTGLAFTFLCLVTLFQIIRLII